MKFIWGSISDLLKCEILLKTVCVESSKHTRGDLVANEGIVEDVRSEKELREEFEWVRKGMVEGSNLAAQRGLKR